MLLIIPVVGGLVAAASAITPIVGTVGGLIIAPVVIKACKNAVTLVKDGKIGLEAQVFMKRISEHEEQIGTIIIEKNLEFDSPIFTDEIHKIKENMKKVEEKELEIIKLKKEELELIKIKEIMNEENE